MASKRRAPESCLGDFELRREEGGEKTEYVLCHTERGSKTRSDGKEFGPERYFDPHIYATGTETCPVKKLPGEKTEGDDDSRQSVLRGGAKESLKCDMV